MLKERCNLPPHSDTECTLRQAAILRFLMEICPKKVRRMPDVEEFHDTDEARMVTETLAWDDLTGMQLDRGKVKEARQKAAQRSRKGSRKEGCIEATEKKRRRMARRTP